MRHHIGAKNFAAFGDDSAIVPPAKILNPHRIHIGNRVLIHEGVWLSVVERYRDQTFTPSLRIGDGAVLGRNTYISCICDIEIGTDVLGGERVLIADSYRDYHDPDTAITFQRLSEPAPVKIGSGALLNVNVSILPGVTIGERACIGAGAVVTHDVPANAVAVGNPARVIRWFDRDAGEWVDGARALGS